MITLEKAKRSQEEGLLYVKLVGMLKDYANADTATLLQVIAKQQETIDKLSQRLDKLLQLLYGTKTEKRKSIPDSDHQATHPIKPEKRETHETGTRNGRRPLPPDLPRVRIEHDLIGDQQYCSCGYRMHKMGKVVTEQLDCKPLELFVREHIRFKYVCKSCSNLVTAALPPQPIDKGLPGAGLLAEVIINKYQDALPLYRQEQRFARHGIDLPRSTLCDWVMQSAVLLEPIVQLMKKDSLLPGFRIFTDDTPVPVLAKSKTHTGRLWVYVGGGFEVPNCVIYDYTPTRAQTAPKNFLGDYQGYLQADAYGGYDSLYKSGKIIEVGCFAHARRKFFEITLASKEPGKADIALEFIGKLYVIEKQAKPFSPLQRKYFRKRYAKPILKQFYRWLKIEQKHLLPKTPIGSAIAYALNHWQALNNYYRDGTLKIDNNTAERAIKPLIIGRKNWLFAGSHEGAKKTAVLYSIIESCKVNEINPYLYIKDVLTRLPSTLMKDLKQLLPYHWKPINL